MDRIQDAEDSITRAADHTRVVTDRQGVAQRATALCLVDIALTLRDILWELKLIRENWRQP